MKRFAAVVSIVGLMLLAGAFTSAVIADDAASAISAVFVAAFPVVGLVITRQQPRNAVAWCFLVSTVLLSMEKIGDELARYGLRHSWPGALIRTFAWAQAWAWFPGLFLIVTVALLRFPNGELLGTRWRWVERASFFGMAVWSVCIGAVGAVVPVRELVSSDSPHPHGVVAVLYLTGVSMFAIVAVCVLCSLASLIVRYRRSSFVGREQTRWVLFAATVAVTIEIGIDVWGSFGSTTDWAQSLGEGIGFALIAIAIGVAITRYKLYEIERIVSRTVTYLVVLAVLVGVYVGVIVVLANLVPADLGQVGVAAATLVASIVAVPLTRRVRGLVDRRFNRARFDQERVVAAFAARLRARPEKGDIPDELMTVLGRTVQPSHAAIWLTER